MDDKRLHYIRLAQELTGSNDISVLLNAARELEAYDELPYDLNHVEKTPPKPEPRSFVEFLSGARLRHPVKGSIPFVPHPYQKNIARRLEEMFEPDEQHGVMINSARQMGVTSLTAMFALWCASELGKSVVIISPKRAMSDNFQDLIRFGWSETLMSSGVVTNNRYTIEFENGAAIRHTTYGLMKGTMSYKSDVIIASDLPFCSFADEDTLKHYLTLGSSLGNKIVLMGGSYHNKGIFYETWTDPRTARFSNTPGIKFEKISVPFYHHPERDDQWATEFKAYLGEDQFNREYDTKFPENGK